MPVRDAFAAESHARAAAAIKDGWLAEEITPVTVPGRMDAGHISVNGGAIAVGHPVGMSGARLVLTLALELRRRGGGGQGDALILRVP